MNDTDALWDRVRDAFKAHQIPGIDRTPQMALGRLAAKCILLSFNDSNCTVREEYLSLDELQQLIRYHDNVHPKRDAGPIVVLVHEGQRFVIDGNKRVNKWLKGGDTELRSARSLNPRRPPVEKIGFYFFTNW